MYGSEQWITMRVMEPMRYPAVFDINAMVRCKTVTMHRVIWLNSPGCYQIGYKCEECKTTIFGSRTEDLKHECTDPRRVFATSC